jgi:2-hydroxychromene-2-carboxylate isomerase
VDEVFANIAQEAGVFDDSFTRDYFLEHLHDWDEVVKPSYGEVKDALNYGVFGTPKHVIDDKLVLDTESAWGPEEWEDKLRSL